MADLKVNGKLVDVKNARASRMNSTRYVTHCVAKFKESRSLELVEVAGVLSEYLTVEQMSDTVEPISVLMLGTTNSQRVALIQHEFSQGPLVLVLNRGLGGPSFLPPWIFDYPESEYPSRDLALRDFDPKSLPDLTLCTREKINPVVPFIAAGHPIDLQIPLTPTQRDFAALLTSRKSRIGLCLPSIYLSLLEHFLILLTAGGNASFNADEHATLLFPTTDRARPMFIFDPLRTVDTLLATLSTLWDVRTQQLAQMKTFRLQELNILLGKKQDSDSCWKTVLAYCGGWLTAPVQRCGMTPLVMGECESCVCGKLICPECDFCGKVCAAGIKRKQRAEEIKGTSPGSNFR